MQIAMGCTNFLPRHWPPSKQSCYDPTSNKKIESSQKSAFDRFVSKKMLAEQRSYSSSCGYQTKQHGFTDTPFFLGRFSFVSSPDDKGSNIDTNEIDQPGELHWSGSIKDDMYRRQRAKNILVFAKDSTNFFMW